jgi:ribosomal protein S12 methylthiotransferase accessory factor
MEMNIFFEGRKRVNAEFNGQIIGTDQSTHAGGEGTSPAPFTLFLVSIGTCAGIHVKSFCQQHNLPTDGITITQKMNYNYKTRMVDKIELKVNLPKNFPEKYKDAVVHAANLCSVKEHLLNPPSIEITT